ncbi:hypothetical protein ACFLQ0_03405 [Nitrospinota bacterium]
MPKRMKSGALRRRLLAAALTGFFAAASFPAGAAGRDELIDRLRDLIREGERKRAADRWFLDGLRGLVRQYDTAWGRELLRDDFRDGDYTRSPGWRVIAGRFEVSRLMGLNSRVSAAGSAKSPEPEKPAEGDLTSAILGEILKRSLEKKSRRPEPAASEAGHAEIFVPQKISNAFSIRMEIISRAPKGRLVFGPYDGNRRDRGYRLAYSPGDKIGLEIYRASRRGTSLVAAYREPLKVEEGRIHQIEWTRERNGEMKVSLDGRELLRASDIEEGGVFNGFTLVNFGGYFGLREIVIYGE